MIICLVKIRFLKTSPPRNFSFSVLTNISSQFKYFFVCANPTEAATSSLVGINYGELGNNLPSLTSSVTLVQSLNFQHLPLPVLGQLMGSNQPPYSFFVR